jgi:hypothetical protein
MIYRGSCHCGAIKFTFESEEITRGKRCNCSICRRKSALMSVAYFENVKVEGAENLSLYLWGDKECNHWFCKTCGIYPFHDATEKPGVYRVNLGCIEEIDVFTLPFDVIDGAAMPLRDPSKGLPLR